THYAVLTLDASDFLFCIVFVAFINVLVQKLIRLTTRHLSFRKIKDTGEGPVADTINSAGQPDASSFEHKASYVKELTKCPSRTAAVRHLHSHVLDSLSREEVEEERRVCKDQLTAIFQVMQSQPDRFGPMSEEDMEQQLSQFYEADPLPMKPR
ncbi:hypothetical protein X801_04458, partial [Opisthorchis viverrini]